MQNQASISNIENLETDVPSHTAPENYEDAADMFAEQLASLLWQQWQFMQDKV